jgi:PAS domain S-box-containing protein
VLQVSQTVRRYILAILVTITALYLRYEFRSLLGNANPYHTLWLAVMFSSWYCGLGPSIVTTLLSAAGVPYFFLPLTHSFAFRDPSEIYGLFGFLILSGVIIALGESNRRSSSFRYWLAAIVESSGDAIISKDLNGIITSWNHGAELIFAWTAKEAIGRPITLIIPPELHNEEVDILRRVQAGERIERCETTRVSKQGKTVFVSLTISSVRDSAGRIVGASKIARDVSEYKLAEKRLKAVHDELEERVNERTAELFQKNVELSRQAELVRNLSARLLRLQDDERRRIARELHDSAGQLIAAINMNNDRVVREKSQLSPTAVRCIEDNVGLIEQALTEIRTMSHLLHPPLLDEVGLGSTIRWYIEGFAQRSKIHVDLEIEPGFDRLTADLEIAVFRVVQECLTNIHRHSGSSTATISLGLRNRFLHLEVADQGTGIPAEKQGELHSSGTLGVGLRGIRERIRELGGTLNICSSSNGTAVEVTLPHRRDIAASAGDGA